MGTIILGTLASMVSLSAPLLIAAEGEVFVERSGQFNMGIEGIMILSALISFAMTFVTGSVALGFLVGAAAGAVLGIFLFLLIEKLNLSGILVAVVFNLLAAGITSFLASLFISSNSVPLRSQKLTSIAIPLLSDIPYIGSILFQQNLVVYLSYLAVPLAGYYLFHTRGGLELRAVGEDAQAAESMGINVFRTKRKCFMIGGVAAGISGAYTSLTLGMFLDAMTENKGFISMALCAFSGQNPYGTFVGSLFFALVDSVQIRLQVYNSGIPYEFMLMLPYILTIIVLAIPKRNVKRVWKQGKKQVVKTEASELPESPEKYTI